MKTASALIFGLLMTLIGTGVFAAVHKVDAPVVRAGDLISNCADFCQVQVANSPAPGQRQVLYARDIQAAIEEAGYALGKRKLTGRYTVIRKSRSADTEELTGFVKHAIETELPEGAVLESMGKVIGGKVPVGEMIVRVSFPTTMSYQQTVSVPVEMVSQDVVFRKVHVLCRLSYYVNVPVASRSIARGELIRPDAVDYKKMKMDSSTRHMVTDIAEISGLKSKIAMRAGDVFDSRNLEQIPVVRRGDAITILSSVRGIRISARGYARQDAVKGDRIAVEIPSLNKMLFARIVSRGFGVVQQ
ncbi:MAG: flagellar basal body P-ring formation protein FlgA [Deltaproteobacteria bacterium]|nr:flagellar basal body P-ring formation protein FlgA [Deltaproteobacteria bacterium]MBN2674737.1 flagellar basal body P-ring formation protein FlgA [Deltaproteobacteria bacterium]